VVFLLVACQGCYPSFPPGGPYYYRSWSSYFEPVIPQDAVSRTEAQAQPVYYEAYFDGKGRIIRWMKYASGKAQFETRYVYGEAGSFEERTCWEGRWVVVEYVRGKEGSPRSEGPCSVD
jgi:hypothetical protein